MELEKMYTGKVNSPTVFLVREIDREETEIEITDSTVLPQAPNLACIGIGEETETILYEEIEGNTLKNCTRGFQGTAKAWEQMTPVARIFTEYDLGSLQKNVGKINTELDKKADESSVVSRLSAKANLVSPALTGTPTAPTPVQTTNNTQIATTAFVKNEIYNATNVEKGTWTPTYGGLTVRGNNKYSIQTGEYYKIGNMVNLKASLQMSYKDPTMKGDIKMFGLPFTSKGFRSNCTVGYTASVKSTNDKSNVVTGYIRINEAQINLGFLNYGFAVMNEENITDNTNILIEVWLQV